MAATNPQFSPGPAEDPNYSRLRESRLERARRQQKRYRFYKSIIRFFRRLTPWLILALLILLALSSRAFLNFLLVAGEFVGRLLFAVMFILVQFVALFYFLSMTRSETILPGDAKGVSFDDYKGQPRLVQLVRQWLTLMEERQEFTAMGGNFINGIMMYGPPGTGKTMLAKAMAGEGSMAFISVEGSGFRGMFLGMDVLRMMQFIGKAKRLAREYGGCIAFIDEIDAVGASRGGVMGGGGGLNGLIPFNLSPMMGGMMGGGGSGALTRLLVAMDGVDEPTRWEKTRNRVLKFFRRPIPKRNWHVLYVGSTNRPGVLDPALTRPGRFDVSVQVDPPDRTGRREIITHYLSKIRHDGNIDVEAIVEDTGGYTPAMIMSAITKNAVRIAIFNKRDYVMQADIDRGFREAAGGLENPIEDWAPGQRRQVAYHEAGHAVAIYHLSSRRRMTRATIIRHGRALGFVQDVSVEEQHAWPLSQTIADIKVSIAGQAATRVALGEPWTGASGGDYPGIRRNFALLAAEGFFGPPLVDPMQQFAAGSFEGMVFDRAWEQMEQFWRDLESDVEALMREHRAELDAVAGALLERDTLMGNEIIALIEGASGGGAHQQAAD